jgi:hypothetical protein
MSPSIYLFRPTANLSGRITAKTVDWRRATEPGREPRRIFCVGCMLVLAGRFNIQVVRRIPLVLNIPHNQSAIKRATAFGKTGLVSKVA